MEDKCIIMFVLIPKCSFVPIICHRLSRLDLWKQRSFVVSEIKLHSRDGYLSFGVLPLLYTAQAVFVYIDLA